jgi:hypothetical protein
MAAVGYEPQGAVFCMRLPIEERSIAKLGSFEAWSRQKANRVARGDYQGASSAFRPRMLRIVRVAVAEAHLADHAEPGLRQWVTGEELEN